MRAQLPMLLDPCFVNQMISPAMCWMYMDVYLFCILRPEIYVYIFDYIRIVILIYVNSTSPPLANR